MKGLDNGQNIQGSSDGVFAVLPLRDIVVFPHMIVPLFVGVKSRSRRWKRLWVRKSQILLATQMNAADDDPEPDAIFDIARSPMCCNC